MKKIGFDNEKYIKLQSGQITKRISQFGGKLYLEFGGKLFDDFHAARVLPGFGPAVKVQMLRALSDKAEIIIVINAQDIEKSKVRGDLGITYDADVLRLIDAFRASDLYVGSVVITHFENQPSASAFRERLCKLGVKVFLHYFIEGYPFAVDRIVGAEGFGKNEYIETERPLVVVTAPGPGSGKLAVCLSQLYHENIRGVKAGYAKFETFPVWNLPLKHPVNLAYEAATADLNDVNMIDPYHLEAYDGTAINYNRDVEAFPVLAAIFNKISGACPYKSPTDMGVNMVGYAMIDDEICAKASRDEIVRRYFACLCEARKGNCSEEAVQKVEMIMRRAAVDVSSRPVVAAANKRAEESENRPAVAIELPDGKIVTGKTSDLLGPSAAVLLNALKHLAGIKPSHTLIDPSVIEPIRRLKVETLGNRNPRLHSDEVLIALCISATLSEEARLATDKLSALRCCEAHSTVILSQVDSDVYRKLGINLTCEPSYQTKKLYHR